MPGKQVSPEFDVFLCHNSADKAAVVDIARLLRNRGLNPWLDVWELKPGSIWQFALEQQIENINAVAVFVGSNGLGPWQNEEVYAFLQEFILRKCPVIPVILPGTLTQPRLPIFLRNRHWIDFRVLEPDPLQQLLWGITDKKAEEANIHTLSTEYDKRFQDPQYATLEGYLRAHLWEKADSETFRLMFSVLGIEASDLEKRKSIRFGKEDVIKLPCEWLITVDGLWVKYSNSHFGFSIQVKEYLRCGGFPFESLDLYTDGVDKNAYERFRKALGWERQTKTQFKISAPLAHLPTGPRSLYLTAPFFSALAYRFLSCTDPTYLSNLQKKLDARLEKDDLSSEKGIDYMYLQRHLQRKQWKAADEWTYNLMLNAVGKRSFDRFNSHDLRNFPCTDLRTIDRLWRKYSNNRFSFSLQKEAYIRCGGTPDGEAPSDKVWLDFVDSIGWRSYGKWLSFEDIQWHHSSNPIGYLPCGLSFGENFFVFLARVHSCGL